MATQWQVDEVEVALESPVPALLHLFRRTSPGKTLCGIEMNGGKVYPPGAADCVVCEDMRRAWFNS